MSAIFSSILLFIGTAASTADPSVPFDPVFECYRVNYAWGFSMSGVAIGRDGTVVRYRLRDRDLGPVPEKDASATYYEGANLHAHLVGATPSNTIDAGTLLDNIALVEDAAKGKVTESPTGVRDAGTSACHAYIPDNDKRRYRDITLGSDGAVSDMRFANDAEAARKLLIWLKAVGVATK